MKQLLITIKPPLRLQRLLDPPGSGYRSETGGLMAALRVLTPEQSKERLSLQMRRLIHMCLFMQFGNITQIIMCPITSLSSSLENFQVERHPY